MLLGIDIGTTVLKAALFAGETGALLASASQRLPVSAAEDGRRETEMPLLDATLDEVVGALRAAAGESWSIVRGIGVASQGGSTIVCRRDSGEPLTPMVLWNDARCYGRLQEIAAGAPSGYWRAFSERDEPGMGLARLQWLKETQPGLLVADNVYAGAGEYVVHRLTGTWRQDACNAAQTGIYDSRRHALTGAPLRHTGARVDLSFFAPLRQGHETHPLGPEAARRWGLPADIPVAGPYIDHEAAFASVAMSADRPLLCSLGTAWVGSFLLPEGLPGRSAFHFLLPAPAGPGRLAIQPLLTGSAAWDWALERFAAPSPAEALAVQDRVFAERLLPPAGLAALPWLNRPNPLAAAANGAGALFGMSAATTSEDMLRAVAAGMASELARVFERPAARGTFDQIVLAGGASKARHFQRMIAALFDPLSTARVAEEDWMGARGALLAFGGPACRAPVAALPAAQRGDTDGLREHQALYRALFDRLYAGVRAGEPYQID